MRRPSALRRILALALLASSACTRPGSASRPAVQHSGSPAPPAASPATSPSAGPSAGPAPAAPAGFTIEATGDLLIHSPVWQRAQAYGTTTGAAYDFRPMLANVRPIIRGADLAICHVETPLSPDDRHITGYPLFNSPHEVADAIADTGYQGCSTASNHAVDGGLAGVSATLSALDRVGVQHAGTARSATEAARIELHQVKGVTVAHLSYTYGTNGMPVPAAQPWLVNPLSVGRVLADAHAAKAAGAQFVIVSLHWGTEYQTAPTAQQQAQAAALLASPDVDLILGDHVHVLQPVERIGDKYVIFGLGNLLSNQSPAAGLPAGTQDGAILKIHVTSRPSGPAVDRVTFIPTYCQIGPYTVWPVAQTLDNPATPAPLRAQLQASWQRTLAAEASLPGHTADATPDAVPIP